MSAENIETLSRFFSAVVLGSIFFGLLRFIHSVPKQLRRIADALEEYLMKGGGGRGK